MDFFDFVRVLVRRWYVTVPALLLTGGAAYGAIELTDPTYQARSAVLLVEPNVPAEPPAGPDADPDDPRTNPYLTFGSSLYVTADVIATVVAQDEAAARVVADGASGTYAVGVDEAGPIVNIEAGAATPPEAIRTAEAVVREIQATLVRIQEDAGAPEHTWIDSQMIVPPIGATEQTGSKIRAAAGTAAAGAAVTLGLVFVVEGVSESRRRRRQPGPPVELPALMAPAPALHAPSEHEAAAPAPTEAMIHVMGAAGDAAPHPGPDTAVPDDDTAVEIVVITAAHGPDQPLFADLHATFRRNFPARVRHELVVPGADLELFVPLADDRCRVRSVEDVFPALVGVPESHAWISPGGHFRPVKALVVKRLVRLAVAAGCEAPVAVAVDADCVFARPAGAGAFLVDGRTRYYRNRDRSGNGTRDVVGERAARELLGLAPSEEAPGTFDYASPVVVWHGDVVRAMLDHVERHADRPWMEAIAAAGRFCEATLYGVYVDEVADHPPVVASVDPMCHTYSGLDPLNSVRAAAVLAERKPTDIAVRIPAGSSTPLGVRRAAMRAAGLL